MYHPVTTEIDKLDRNIKNLVNSLIKCNYNFIVIYPNNDKGSSVILEEYQRLREIINLKFSHL